VRTAPGSIINVTSVAGRIARASLAPYAASKWVLEALSECLAQEMRAFNIRVAIVDPGIIATPILTKGYPIPAGGSPIPMPGGSRPSSPPGSPIQPAPVVGDLIRDIVDGDSWQLRYPAGLDAALALKGGGRAGRSKTRQVGSPADGGEPVHLRVRQPKADIAHGCCVGAADTRPSPRAACS
jgi:hypothetical protein